MMARKNRAEQYISDARAVSAIAASACGAQHTEEAGMACRDWYHLMQWSDSMLPVGGFAFSCALESAVQMGVVYDTDTLQAFTETALRQSAHGDAIALAHAHRLGSADDRDGLLAVDKAVFARKLTEESRAMSLRMGRKLLDLSTEILGTPAVPAAENAHTANAHTAVPALRFFSTAVRDGHTHGTWPVAQGLVFAAVGLSTLQALTAHQYNVAVTILNAALRLMRVTHIDTQRILYRVAAEAGAQCRHAAASSLGQMCAFAPVTDILSAMHERAHVRLFMN